MRRSLSGVLFLIGATCLAVAGGGWWLQRVAFDTARSGDLAVVVLEDPAIRNQVATVAADATAETLGLPAADVRARVAQLATSPAAQPLMQQIVADAHGTLIGARPGPVQITSAQLVELTRDQRVAGVPPVTLPVERVTALSVIRSSLGWVVPIAAIAGALTLLLALIVHPRKSDALTAFGFFCVIAAAGVLLIGYVVPVHLFPEVDDAVWAAVIPAVAADALPLVLAASLALCAGGLGLVFVVAAVRRRRPWSSPIEVHRARDQHRWS